MSNSDLICKFIMSFTICMDKSVGSMMTGDKADRGGEMDKQEVLAMYDVRGIQNYIFRTAKVKDAIGASAIVENIIGDALKYAVKAVSLEKNSDFVVDLEWCSEEGICEYAEKGNGKSADVQVLYIGGGNGFVTYSSKTLCRDINRIMAKYVLEQTYSLQLAIAVVDKNGDYSIDYKNLYDEMNRTKADMSFSRPLGALPVMDVEIKTGYPLVSKEGSFETLLKNRASERVRASVKHAEKVFDNYVTEKGIDSTLAVVHIDGNNMGLRIRELVEGCHDYTKAVNTMRKISFQINSCYKKAFQSMSDFFNENADKHTEFDKKEKKNFVMKVLTAGDDITYVCNGKIALASVEYFTKRIAGYTLNGLDDRKSIEKYGFSVCAGVAYMGSHFPFQIGYEVAEACCDHAKDRAKEEKNMDGDRIGNFVDFQICRNVQTRNLSRMREKEYVTSHGEQLLIRPYFIPTDTDGEGRFKELKEENYSFDNFREAVLFFRETKNMPRSFVKELRNTYSLGENQMNMLYAFLESRNWEMPDKSNELYYVKNDGNGKAVKTAKWYDALEMADYYIDLNSIQEEEGHGDSSVEN